MPILHQKRPVRRPHLLLNSLKSPLVFKQISQFFLYLFVVFVPFQLGFLFSSPRLYFSGEFIPFLSNFLYLSDVFLLFSLFFFGFYWFFDEKLKIISFEEKLRNDKLFFWSFLFLLSLALSLVFSVNFFHSLMLFLRFLGFFAFSWLISVNFVPFKRLAYIFILSLSLISVIGILQFILQHSVGLHVLGEPIVSNNFLGVAKVELFGKTLLRSYGTFSHPNVFAAYLGFAIILLLFLFKDVNSKLKYYFACLLLLLFTALVLTFSRSAFFALAVVFLFYVFQKKRSVFLNSFLVLLTIFALFLAFWGHGDVSLVERFSLMGISKNVFLAKPWGIGIGNFTAVMPFYSSIKLLPWNYQPVHNIFLLLLNEVGLQGLVIFVILLLNIFIRFFRQKNFMILALLFLVFIIGLFDHYFISLYQGQFLLWFFIGLSGLFQGTFAGKNSNNAA